LAIEDNDLAQAIRYIRDHATQPIEIEHVLREVAISRRRLERGFLKVLGRSPLAEIRRQRIVVAKRLLAETDMAIPDVAEAAGFGAATHFTFVFKREAGLSPLKYRTAMRAR
jgi:LacI family transcriptional regulator